MKLSTKSYYGLRAMTRLAEEAKPCSVKEISSKEKLPEKYLEKICQELRSAGFLSAQKGASGGYELARSPRQIKAKDIIMTLEEEEALTRCQSACPFSTSCSSQTFWQEMEKSFAAAMGSTTLADLIKQPKKKKHA